jgi:methionyl-tRNA formyltransferase
VVTRPDREKGRGLTVAATAVKAVAEKVNLRIYQPAGINRDEAWSLLKELKPDLFIVIAYGQILSQKVLDAPKKFCLNVHASLLPQYRGAAPINWAIIKGEKSTGITVMKMVKEMDAGPVIVQDQVPIADKDTSVSMERELAALAAGLLLSSLEGIEKNNYTLTPQSEEGISFAPKLKKQDGLIHWDKTARDIYNLIRGCLPWPGAFTYYRGKLLKIYKAEAVSLSGLPFISPGEIIEISKKAILVGTGEGNLRIQELQLEGKKRMGVQEFIAGHKIKPGDKLG